MRQLRAVWGSIIVATFTWAVLASIPNPSVAAAQITPNRGGPYGARGAIDPPPLETDLTLLTVTVANKMGAVAGLGRDRFQVLEDGVEQKISYFWMDNRPISVGFVMDGSSSMDDLMNEAIRGAGAAYLKSKKAEDEYFVIVFSNNPTMTTSYTTDAKQVPHLFSQTGESPLYDAIYTGIDALKEAANPRKLLLVIAAGFDNGKGMTDDQLVNFAIKQPVQVYSIQLGGTPVVANLLDLLSGVTGGRANLSNASSFQVEAMCNEMALAVKTQYLIGYKSTNTETNGHRRGVKVKVTPPDGSSKLTVWTVSGYYGPKAPKTKSTSAGGK